MGKIIILILILFISLNAFAQPVWQISDEWMCEKKYKIENFMREDNEKIDTTNNLSDENHTQFFDFSKSTMAISGGTKFKITKKIFWGDTSYIFIEGTDDNPYQGVVNITKFQINEFWNTRTNVDGLYNMDYDLLTTSAYKCNAID